MVLESHDSQNYSYSLYLEIQKDDTPNWAQVFQIKCQREMKG